MTIDNIPDSYFVGKRFTRDNLRSAIGQFNAELRSPEFAEAFGADPEISPAELAKTAEYVQIIESAMAGKDAE